MSRFKVSNNELMSRCKGIVPFGVGPNKNRAIRGTGTMPSQGIDRGPAFVFTATCEWSWFLMFPSNQDEPSHEPR